MKFKEQLMSSIDEIQLNLAQSIFWRRGFKFIQMKQLAFLQGEITTNSWNTLTNLKFFFSKTSGMISIRIGTIKAFWIKWIQVFSNEGSCPFPRGDNNEIAKIHWWNLKIFFTKSTGPYLTKLGSKDSWLIGI